MVSTHFVTKNVTARLNYPVILFATIAFRLNKENNLVYVLMERTYMDFNLKSILTENVTFTTIRIANAKENKCESERMAVLFPSKASKIERKKSNNKQKLGKKSKKQQQLRERKENAFNWQSK